MGVVSREAVEFLPGGYEGIFAPAGADEPPFALLLGVVDISAGDADRFGGSDDSCVVERTENLAHLGDVFGADAGVYIGLQLVVFKVGDGVDHELRTDGEGGFAGFGDGGLDEKDDVFEGGGVILSELGSGV